MLHKMDQDVWVIIPAHNERKTIAAVVRETKKYCSNVVVVDDGSKDKTADQVAGAVVLRHLVNMGKGAALKTGCDYAVKNGAAELIVLDADGQHSPKDIPRFLAGLKRVDVVFSYRRLNKKMPAVFKLGNFLLTKITKLLYNVNLRDTQCGYRAFTAATYRKIRWAALDYSMESEMIAKVGILKIKYVQIPIDTVYADDYKGTTVVDGLKIALDMLMWRLSRW